LTNQDTLYILLETNFHYCDHETLPLVPILDPLMQSAFFFSYLFTFLEVVSTANRTDHKTT